MKKLILAATVLALAGMNIQTATAGEHEWATVGKVLTGVAIGAAVVSALDCEPAYISVSYTYNSPVYAPPVVYAQRPVVVTPAPVVIYHSPVCYVPPRPLVSVNVGYANGYTHHRGFSYGHHRR
jgi:hypothetical protein